MQKDIKSKLSIQEGSKICVIGGGPAGSFFSFFAFELALKKGINIEIDIYEPKDFNQKGSPGCNHCGGVVSESLVHMLSADGITLPEQVIRRGIETYTLHLEHGSTVIEAPKFEQRIVSMFRGSGPNGSDASDIQSFDGFLQDLCTNKGAMVFHERVTDVLTEPDGITIITSKSRKKYDLVVGAAGLNEQSLSLFKKLVPAFIPPKTAQTHISEYFLEKDLIDKHFGNSMHVFLLNMPGIKFGALIPKGSYVTLVLLGSKIKRKMVDRFLNSESILACFPEGTELKNIKPCQCSPYINVRNGKHPYSDRVVLIGDSSSSKLYKNGIGAAYLTAKAAANTVISNGISGNDFKKSFQPVCSQLNADNVAGKLIFFITTIIQRSRYVKKVIFQMVVKEQKKEKGKREISSLLWDTFTGSASYRNILWRSMNLFLFAKLVWKMFSGLFYISKKLSSEIKRH
jgi:flavin-dependent dehydrogenase